MRVETQGEEVKMLALSFTSDVGRFVLSGQGTVTCPVVLIPGFMASMDVSLSLLFATRLALTRGRG